MNRIQTTSFDVYINGQIRSNATIMLRNYPALEVAIRLSEETQYSLELNPTSNSTLSLIINALEYYFIFGTDPETYSQDSKCLPPYKTHHIEIAHIRV